MWGRSQSLPSTTLRRILVSIVTWRSGSSWHLAIRFLQHLFAIIVFRRSRRAIFWRSLSWAWLKRRKLRLHHDGHSKLQINTVHHVHTIIALASTLRLLRWTSVVATSMHVFPWVVEYFWICFHLQCSCFITLEKVLVITILCHILYWVKIVVFVV